MKLKKSTIIFILMDSVEKNITLQEACDRAGVPHSVLQEALNKSNSDKQKANKEILSKIRQTAMQLMHDMKKFEEKKL